MTELEAAVFVIVSALVAWFSPYLGDPVRPPRSHPTHRGRRLAVALIWPTITLFMILVSISSPFPL